MKNHRQISHLFPRATQTTAAALVAVSLGLASAVAQGSDTSSTSTAPSRQDSLDTTSGTPRAYENSPTTAPSRRSDDSLSTSTSTRDSSASALKRADKRFITKVAEGSAKEVAIAQLAVQKSSNPQVKSYAQQLVNDHRQLNSELLQLAQSKGVSVELPEWVRSSGDSSMSVSNAASARTTTSESSSPAASEAPANMNVASTTDHELTSDRHYRNLARRSGADFDKAFVDMMVDDHKKDVKMFESESKDADDSAVRTFAATHLAKFQEHLDRAQNLKQLPAE
jgi:putative membrane protein